MFRARPWTASQGAISLMQHLQTWSPAFVASLQRSATATVDPFFWDPVLTSVLNLPGTVIFLLLTIACGYLDGRAAVSAFSPTTTDRPNERRGRLKP